MKAIADLSKCIEAIQTDLVMLKCEATQGGSSSQTRTQPCVPKRPRKDESDVEEEDEGEDSSSLVPLYRRRQVPFWNPCLSLNWTMRRGRQKPQNYSLSPGGYAAPK